MKKLITILIILFPLVGFSDQGFIKRQALNDCSKSLSSISTAGVYGDKELANFLVDDDRYLKFMKHCFESFVNKDKKTIKEIVEEVKE